MEELTSWVGSKFVIREHFENLFHLADENLDDELSPEELRAHHDALLDHELLTGWALYQKEIEEEL